MHSFPTINSLTLKPHPFQLFSYLVFIFQIIAFYLAQAQGVHLPTLVVYTIVCFLFLATFFASSLIDPTDLRLKDVSESQNEMEILFCDDCNGYVGQTSKHCKICNRCVQQFDHHCKFINNCIGRQNYRCFMAMLLFAMLQLSTFIGYVGIIIGQKVVSGPTLFLWVVAIPNGIVLVLILQLFLFHVYLSCKGLSTYEWILIKRAEDMSKSNTRQNTHQHSVGDIRPVIQQNKEDYA